MINYKTKPQNDLGMVEELEDFCNEQYDCWCCCLDDYLDCCFHEYNSEQLNEAYNIIKENNDESTD